VVSHLQPVQNPNRNLSIEISVTSYPFNEILMIAAEQSSEELLSDPLLTYLTL